ncbi:hypothetical protein LCGC14_1076270 [marine sediment metagenome]|uniref:Uncharacterized protein n=1 Tax=marine sediment metagenome TaxID=412755 RepID=A0A0F9QMG0_9ZZZZ
MLELLRDWTLLATLFLLYHLNGGFPDIEALLR